MPLDGAQVPLVGIIYVLINRMMAKEDDGSGLTRCQPTALNCRNCSPMSNRSCRQSGLLSSCNRIQKPSASRRLVCLGASVLIHPCARVQPPGVPFPSLGEGVSAPSTPPDSVKTPGHRGRCATSHVCKSHLTKPVKNNLDVSHFLIQVKLHLVLAFLAFTSCGD